MLTSLLLTAAFAQDLTLTVDGDLEPGATVTVTIDGLTPGEPAFLATSDALGQTCPAVTAPFCSDLVRPRVLARGAPPTSTVTLDVTLPAHQTVHHLQAISTTGVSPLAELDIGPADETTSSPPLVIGVAISCDIDRADLIAQYMGDADELVASAWIGGVRIADHPLFQEPAPEGSIFFDATKFGADAPACGDLTWVIEAVNPSISTCVVRGDEADDLRTAGDIPSNCADI